MHVHQDRACVIVHTPAKLNLFFEVLGRRDDGFHEIETLMVPIRLFDTLTFSPQASESVELDCRWASPATPRPTAHSAAPLASSVDHTEQEDNSGKGSVPNSQVDSLGTLPPAADNLATRAALLLRQRAGITQGASMSLIKRIPSAAGLGGGSSDAAAALLAANLAWKLNWSRERLMALAAELGSDVPFFLVGGAAVCRGRGEQVEPLDLPQGLHGVVVRPPAGLATAEVYRHCAPGKPARRVEDLVQALRQRDMRLVARSLHNRLEEAALKLSPWVRRLKNEFAALHCPAAQMSGSGSSYFALCHHAVHARQTAARLRARRLGRVWAVRW